MKAGNHILISYRKVLRLLDKQRRILTDVDSDPNVIRVFETLLEHLQGLSDLQILQIVQGRKFSETYAALRPVIASDVSKMTLDDVQKIVEDADTPRGIIETIAIGRFQVPKGSLRSIGNLVQLREKVLTMARNERAHTTIAEIAKDKST